MSGDVYDAFDDIRRSNSGGCLSGGGFGGSSLDEFEKVDWELTDTGVAILSRCAGFNSGCGVTNQLEIDWADPFCLAYGLNPAQVRQFAQQQFNMGGLFNGSIDWQYDRRENGWRPKINCGCGAPVSLAISPNDIKRMIGKGKAKQVFIQDWFNRMKAICEKAVQAGLRVV